MQPLWADFNACDNDGAVLMGAPPFLNMHLQETDFVPTDGANVLISDGEIELTGTLAFRDNKYWVTIPVEGCTKKVPKDACEGQSCGMVAINRSQRQGISFAFPRPLRRRRRSRRN